MKAASFHYAAPESLDGVFELLGSADDGRVIAGGQSLVPMMALRLARPDPLVDLKNVASLHEVDVGADGLVVGAMVSQTALAAREDAHPLLREAIPLIAHPQIRNRGTVVGSLAHADPAAELPAVAVALGARLRVRGPAGERSIAARDFFDSYFTTTLEPGEVVVSVELPVPERGEGWAIAEVARRHGDFALAGVVVRLMVDESGVVRTATVVPFAVGERPVGSTGAEGALLGLAPSDDDVSRAAELTAAEVDPPSDQHAGADYRRRAVEVLTARALRRALQRTAAHSWS